MKKDQLLSLCEQVEQLVNELNSLDFTKPEEDALFNENLARLEDIENKLSSDVPQAKEIKTKKYLH